MAGLSLSMKVWAAWADRVGHQGRGMVLGDPSLGSIQHTRKLGRLLALTLSTVSLPFPLLPGVSPPPHNVSCVCQFLSGGCLSTSRSHPGALTLATASPTGALRPLPSFQPASERKGASVRWDGQKNERFPVQRRFRMVHKSRIRWIHILIKI